MINKKAPFGAGGGENEMKRSYVNKIAFMIYVSSFLFHNL